MLGSVRAMVIYENENTKALMPFRASLTQAQTVGKNDDPILLGKLGKIDPAAKGD